VSTKLPLHLEGLSKSELEGMCVSCGLCCYAAVPLAKGLNVLVPELRCKFLVQKGSEGETCCSVYEERFEKAKGWCLPLADAVQKGIFPDACPYVKDMKGYVGKAIFDDHSLQLVMPQIRKALAADGQPAWISDGDWKSFTRQETK
jgi:uncharacterized cysteine cluster protein YcgN (CxxCxxCC family)